MKNLISDCILSNNFTRFGHKILIRNETSHTLMTKPELISIKELKENGLTLEVPLNTCQKGHNLTLFFLHLNLTSLSKLPDSGPYKDAQFEAMVKVEKVEKNKENTVFIDVNFTQYNIELWKNVLSQYQKNQEEINKMIMCQHTIRDEE